MAKATTAKRKTGTGTSCATQAGDVLDPQTIRAKAHELYARRIEEGLPGDALSDWLEAERNLKAEAAARIAGLRGEKRNATRRNRQKVER